MTAQMTGPGDLRDQRWLDEQVTRLGDGIESARAIWSNWYEGRCVGRLHPDMTPGEYIASLGLRLTLVEAMAALPDGSTREVAAVADVSHMTVARARAVTNVTGDEGRVRGGDGKTYPARVVQAVVIDEPMEEAPPRSSADLRSFIHALEAMNELRQSADAADLAQSVVPSSVVRTRANVKRVHAWLGAIAHELDKR